MVKYRFLLSAVIEDYGDGCTDTLQNWGEITSFVSGNSQVDEKAYVYADFKNRRAYVVVDGDLGCRVLSDIDNLLIAEFYEIVNRMKVTV